jgi:hypothetical protein
MLEERSALESVYSVSSADHTLVTGRIRRVIEDGSAPATLLRPCGRLFRDDTINGPLRMFERYFSHGGRQMRRNPP